MDRKRVLSAEITNYTTSEESGAEVEKLREMLKLDPESLDVREWLAFRLYTSGRLPEAAEAYQDLISRGHRKGVQYFHLGNAYYKMKKYSQAVDAWRKTTELMPEDPKAEKAQLRIQKVQLLTGEGR